MDYYYEVEMGVAVTGGRRIGMRTTTLYNCLGLAAVNSNSRRGGLYHYPSLSQDKSYVVVTLTRMLNNVLPDRIEITPAAVASSFEVGSDPSDIDWLIRTVAKLAPSAKVGMSAGRGAASLFWEGGQLKYNEHPSPAPGLIRPEMSKMKNVITGRPQNGDAWAYGIDLEENAVAKEPPGGKAAMLVAKYLGK